MKILSTNLFLSHISVQQKNLHRYICPKCSHFSTECKIDFQNHIIEIHSEFDFIDCVYCSVVYSRSDICAHIDTHFTDNSSSNCLCKLCDCFVKIDCVESVLEHLYLVHDDRVVCPVCLTDFLTDSDLVDHLNRNFLTIFHCNYENCFVKTNDFEEFYWHLISSEHYSDSSVQETNISCLKNDDVQQFRFNYDNNDDFIDQLSIKPPLSSVPNKEKLKESENSQPKVHEKIKSDDKFLYKVRLKFDKQLIEEIIANINNQISVEVQENLINIDRYFIGVSLVNKKKHYFCSHCDYCSKYQHADVRKHILLMHCSINCSDLRPILRLVRFSNEEIATDLVDLEPIDQEVPIKTELSTSLEIVDNPEPMEIENNNNDSNVTDDKIDRKYNFTIHLSLNKSTFNLLFKREDRNVSNSLEMLLTNVQNYSIGGSIINDQKLFACSKCSYASKYNHADVRKHIIIVHLGISCVYLRQSLKCIHFFTEKIKSEDYPTECSSQHANHSISQSKSTDDSNLPIESLYESNIDFQSDKLSLTISRKKKHSIDSEFDQSNENLSEKRLKIDIERQPSDVIKMEFSRKSFVKRFRNLSKNLVEELREKMENFSKYSVKVQSIPNENIQFACESCDYFSSGCNEDIERHIMASHCKIGPEMIDQCLQMCRIDYSKFPQKSIENQSSKDIFKQWTSSSSPPSSNISSKNNNKENVLTNDNLKQTGKTNKIAKSMLNASQSNLIIIDREVSLNYSATILKALCDLENLSSRFKEISEKMNCYCQTRVRVGKNADCHIYICSKCLWFTRKSIAAVSNHVLEKHTGLTRDLIGVVEKCTRIDSCGQLLSDEELSSLGWNDRPILSQRNSDNAFIDLKC